MRAPRCRLYLITPPRIPDIGAFAHVLRATLDAGDVACLQIRIKTSSGSSTPDDEIRALSDAVMADAQARNVAVLINDRPDLALELGADGAHLGQGDMPCAKARKLLGPDRILGVTCHDSRHLALEAGEAGADYVAFGAFHPTQTKETLHQADASLLSWWQEMIEIPCVAIGGITVANARPLVEAGADFLAVSSGVWGHPGGPGAAVKAFNAIFDAEAGGG
ncbi:MAG: thiamine phosphate synthase [Alphaproteobacteria bacterium]|nr:thiamine phosphate synthase [Alphaproteobacteria bacterium]